MQQGSFELKNGYQMIPVGIAAVMAAVVGCVTHFFKIDVGTVSGSTVTLLTAAGVFLLYGFDLSWMRYKVCDLQNAASMADVRFSENDRNVLILNIVVISCYILLSTLL